MKPFQKETNSQIERYELKSSPLAQKMTQRDLAALVGLKRDKLRNLITHKEEYIVRRVAEINGKTRKLVYPFGKFRSVHEKLKYQLNKVIQPDYLYSPRKGKNQRLNAVQHVGQTQFLKLDIKQFYPSTSSEHVFRWAKYELGMRDDVAGLFTQIATIDGIVSFGSPLTPVLTTLLHRKIFDDIAAECKSRGLRITLWVDDMVISGKFVPGLLINRIRDIIRSNGLRSHKLEYFTGSRAVKITGIMVRGNTIDAPRKLHNEVCDGYGLILQTHDPNLAGSTVDKLLSTLGRYRNIVGRKTHLGRIASSRMNAVRQEKPRIIAQRRRVLDSLE